MLFRSCRVGLLARLCCHAASPLMGRVADLIYGQAELSRCRIDRHPVDRHPKPHVISFWPRIVYSLCNFYGATMTIKGSFILEHPHVKAVFGRKSPVKIGPQNVVFFGNLSAWISNIVIETPKRHSLTRNDVFRRTLRKNPFRGVGCSVMKNPKKRRKKL